jgi:hypothetical protein
MLHRPPTRLRTRLRLESLEHRDLPSFITAHSIALGFSPQSQAVGDFTGDGIPDIALGGDGTVTILKGKGDGTFKFASVVSVGTGGVGVLVAADLNGDGKTDLAAIHGVVSVLLGNGNGSFSAPADYPVGPEAVAMVAADLNGDGRTDLVACSFSPKSVSVLLNTGNGNFASAVDYPVFGIARDVVAGDFDRDNDLDLAVSGDYYDDGNMFNGSFVEILRNQGNGTFVPGAIYKDNLYAPGGVVAGDFDQDGNLDLATASGYKYPVGGAYVSVRLGHGDGTFAEPQRYAADTDGSIATGDVDGDGLVDIVSSNFEEGTVSVLKGFGNGGFQQAPGYAVGGSAHHLALADLDGDGHPDMVVLNGNDQISKPGAVTVLRDKGNGFFLGATIFPSAAGTDSIASADFNGDGVPDLALAAGNPIIGSAVVSLGNGDGTFAPAVSYAVGNVPREVIAADLNGDGWPDLAVTNAYSASVSILINKDDGTFFPAKNMAAGSEPGWVVAADFTNDGKTDLVVSNANQSYSFLRGTGIGRFRAPVPIPVNGVDGDLAADDVDGDGTMDLVAAVGGTVEVFRGNGHGSFQLTESYVISTGYNLDRLLAADFNNDGIVDVAVVGGSKVHVLLGKGDGTFQVKGAYDIGVYPSLNGLAAADLNRDGKIDLVVSSLVPGLAVLRGNGDGSFQPSLVSPNASGYGADSVTAADFNRDGWPDVAASQFDGLGPVVALNAADWTAPAPPGSGSATGPSAGRLNSSAAAEPAGLSLRTRDRSEAHPATPADRPPSRLVPRPLRVHRTGRLPLGELDAARIAFA